MSQQFGEELQAHLAALIMQGNTAMFTKMLDSYQASRVLSGQMVQIPGLPFTQTPMQLQQMPTQLHNALLLLNNSPIPALNNSLTSPNNTMNSSFGSANNSLVSNGLNVSLDREIPRDEIECDLEIVMVKGLLTSLKRLDNTSLKGFDDKKLKFRNLIEKISKLPQFPNSPGSSEAKRKRTFSIGSAGTQSPLSLVMSPPTSVGAVSTNSDDDCLESQAKKMKIEDTSVLNDSAASSHEGSLVIDLPESAKEDTNAKVEENTKTEERSPDKTSEEQKSCMMRVERMKNHQKKKPSVNIEDLTLSYHSNMARNFPGSENRTADQQARRSKNTTAARMSRHKNKAYEEYLERESIAVVKKNFELKRKIACLRAYASSLMDLNGAPNIDFDLMWEGNIKQITASG